MTAANLNSDSLDTWFAAEGEEDGKPLIFRGRQNIPQGVRESDYGTLLSIFWEYDSDGESGMPDEQTNNRQIELEDALENLDALGKGFMMLVVTGNGRKEWHWYVADLEVWMGGLNESLAAYDEFPIEIENRTQPNWDLYKNFIAGMIHE